MKKKVYKEQYRTLVLFTRIDFFALASSDSEKDDDIERKIRKIFFKNKLNKMHNTGFIHFRGSRKRRFSIFTPFLRALGFSRMCPIYNIPGCYAADNTNPRKIYQKWCKAFDGQFTQEELDYIEKTAIKASDELRYRADIIWENMKAQEDWTFLKELKSLFTIWKEKLSK